MTPFNIDILILDKGILKQLGQITNLAIMKSSTKDFTDDGLFSTTIFGPVGSDERNVTFGYIDLKYPILHPLIFQLLGTLKVLYKDVMNGKRYAKWDNKEKDLVETTREEGRTGYQFMMEHVHKIKFHDNDSDERAFKIKLIKKYTNDTMMLDHWLVLPAGLRDYTVDDDGTPKEDEINDLYRKLIATVNSLNSISVDKNNLDLIDPIRVKIQNITLEIYEYIKVLLDGKSKFIQGKWTKRAITYGTRNVITSVPSSIDDIDNVDKPGFNDTIIGLYQYISAISPVIKYYVHTKFINKIINSESTIATVVDPKTMQTINTTIDASKRDEWLSYEGLDGIINKLSQEVIRTEPVMLDKYYMLLIYDDGKTVMPVFNTETLSDDYNRKYLRPITYAELFYISIYEIRKKYPAYLTRYPVVDLGGIYPTKLYLKTTVNGRTVKFVMGGIESTMVEYPVLTEKFYNSLSPHLSKLEKLVGD